MNAAETPTRSLPISPVALDAWVRLLMGHSGLLRTLDAELRQAHNVTLGDYDVLAHLANVPREGLRMCDLANAVLLSPSGLSRRVDRLERAGLLARERGAQDARNIHAQLTRAGRRLFRRIRDTHLAGVDRHFAAHFDQGELETLRDLLGRLNTPA